MFAFASLSRIGSSAFFASCPKANASARAFSIAPESRRSARPRRTSSSRLRRFAIRRASEPTSIELPSLRAWIATRVTLPSRRSVPVRFPRRAPSPTTSRMSSTIWKAIPRFRPYSPTASMSSRRAPGRRPMFSAPAMIGKAVLRVMMSRYSWCVTAVSKACRFWRISPSARAAHASAVSSTISASNLPPMPKALTNRKSPVIRAFCNPNFLYAVRRPRRISPPSLMSSWIRVAEWMSSKAAARSIACAASVPPRARKARRVTIGRMRLPPASMTYRAISWRRGSSETMLWRIFASTRAISGATPKSRDGVVKALAIRAIAPAYITISGVCCRPAADVRRLGRNRDGLGRQLLTARRFARDLDDRAGGHGPVDGDALDRRCDRLEERVDHVVAVADPIGHHHDGHHDRHEWVDERLVLNVRCRKANRLRRQVRDALKLAVVVLDGQVRIVGPDRGQPTELVLSHRDEGEVRDSIPEVVVDAHDVVQQGDRRVVVVPPREEVLHPGQIVHAIRECHVDDVVPTRRGNMACQPLPPFHRVVRRIEVLPDPLHPNQRKVRLFFEHREGLAQGHPLVHDLHLVEVVVAVGRPVPEDVESANGAADQVEQRDVFLAQHRDESLREAGRLEIWVEHGAQDHVVELFCFQI